jgi:hypothetical protein
MRILLLGSTVLSAHVEAALPEVIGHVPSAEPAFPGKMLSPVVAETTPHDIKLSVQFDRKLRDTRNAYNLHTGLLPQYGGRDILHHTLMNGDREQGLSFHAMSDQFDAGPLISTITYPVLPSDGIIELYQRMLIVAPLFVRSSLALLPFVDVTQISGWVPKLYKHSDIKDWDRYKRDGDALSRFLRDRGLME